MATVIGMYLQARRSEVAKYRYEPDGVAVTHHQSAYDVSGSARPGTSTASRRYGARAPWFVSATIRHAPDMTCSPVNGLEPIIVGIHSYNQFSCVYKEYGIESDRFIATTMKSRQE
jgi:hypothetical protein